MPESDYKAINSAITKGIEGKDNLKAKYSYFSKVKMAREILREKALEILAKYELIIDKALEKGDFETAAKHTQWLLEHMPNEEGERLIDPSAAKPKEVERGSGPSIQIGLVLGGLSETKKLPPSDLIDVEVLKDE